MVLLLLTVVLTGCSTAPFHPVDLQQPGWKVYQGQAVWQRPQAAPDIAGDVLLALRPTGDAFVQFGKNGFPLLVAQSAPNHWQVELPTQNQRYSGGGLPPRRLLILYLPRALEGQALPAGWAWSTSTNGGWRLENRRSGEYLEGYFNP